jgi:hypothetical protein
MVAAAVSPERLIFVDECGTHTSLAPIYDYAPRGERLRICRYPEAEARTHLAALEHDALTAGGISVDRYGRLRA